MPNTKTFADQLYDDPEAAIANVVAAERQRMKQELNQIRFWDKFYAANGDLEPDRDLVSAVLKDNHEELLPLDVPTAIDRLAELSREKIEANVRRQSRQKEYQVMRGGLGVGPGEMPPVPDETEYSMSSTIKRRRQQKREAHSNFITRRAE